MKDSSQVDEALRPHARQHLGPVVPANLLEVERLLALCPVQREALGQELDVVAGVAVVRALAGDGAYLAVQLPQLRVVPELLQDDGPPLRGGIFALGDNP